MTVLSQGSYGRVVKARFNYERTQFDRSIKVGSEKRDHEDVFLTELQLAF